MLKDTHLSQEKILTCVSLISREKLMVFWVYWHIINSSCSISLDGPIHVRGCHLDVLTKGTNEDPLISVWFVTI